MITVAIKEQRELHALEYHRKTPPLKASGLFTSGAVFEGAFVEWNGSFLVIKVEGSKSPVYLNPASISAITFELAESAES